MTTMLELRPPATAEPTEDIEFIDDLEELSADGRCACNASDDNPF